eukprot:jgi/Psemu1/476/gm1.476_g
MPPQVADRSARSFPKKQLQQQHPSPPLGQKNPPTAATRHTVGAVARGATLTPCKLTNNAAVILIHSCNTYIYYGSSSYGSSGIYRGGEQELVPTKKSIADEEEIGGRQEEKGAPATAAAATAARPYGLDQHQWKHSNNDNSAGNRSSASRSKHSNKHNSNHNSGVFGQGKLPPNFQKEETHSTNFVVASETKKQIPRAPAAGATPQQGCAGSFVSAAQQICCDGVYDEMYGVTINPNTFLQRNRVWEGLMGPPRSGQQPVVLAETVEDAIADAIETYVALTAAGGMKEKPDRQMEERRATYGTHKNTTSNEWFTALKDFFLEMGFAPLPTKEEVAAGGQTRHEGELYFPPEQQLRRIIKDTTTTKFGGRPVTQYGPSSVQIKAVTASYRTDTPLRQQLCFGGSTNSTTFSVTKYKEYYG